MKSIEVDKKSVTLLILAGVLACVCCFIFVIAGSKYGIENWEMIISSSVLLLVAVGMLWMASAVASYPRDTENSGIELERRVRIEIDKLEKEMEHA